MTRKNVDLRRINAISDACNLHGTWYTYARVGSGKDSFVATLHVGKKTKADAERLGTVYSRRPAR